MPPPQQGQSGNHYSQLAPARRPLWRNWRKPWNYWLFWQHQQQVWFQMERSYNALQWLFNSPSRAHRATANKIDQFWLGPHQLRRSGAESHTESWWVFVRAVSWSQVQSGWFLRVGAHWLQNIRKVTWHNWFQQSVAWHAGWLGNPE